MIMMMIGDGISRYLYDEDGILVWSIHCKLIRHELHHAYLIIPYLLHHHTLPLSSSSYLTSSIIISYLLHHHTLPPTSYIIIPYLLHHHQLDCRSTTTSSSPPLSTGSDCTKRSPTGGGSLARRRPLSRQQLVEVAREGGRRPTPALGSRRVPDGGGRSNETGREGRREGGGRHR